MYIGVDVGATKTHLTIGEDLSDAKTLQGGGANVMEQGVEVVADRVIGLIHEALPRQSTPETVVEVICVGVAGAGRPEDPDRIQNHLMGAWNQEFPHRSAPRVKVVSDIPIAVEAALRKRSGVVVLVGSGSFVFGRSQTGQEATVGGWGRILGDVAGGYSLGRQVLRRVAWALDGGERPRVVQLVMEQFEIESRDDFFRRIYRDNWPIQNVAPLLLQSVQEGDEWAGSVLNQEIDDLMDQVVLLINQMEDGVDTRLALMGGLARNTTYREVFNRAAGERLDGWKTFVPDRSPSEGAWLMAEGLA